MWEIQETGSINQSISCRINGLKARAGSKAAVRVELHAAMISSSTQSLKLQLYNMACGTVVRSVDRLEIKGLTAAPCRSGRYTLPVWFHIVT